MSFKSNQYVAVLISLRHKTILDKFVNLWLTNAEFNPEADIPQYFPALENVTGVGVAQNSFTPQFTSGSIRLDNSRDSMAFQKRFTDLCANYVHIKAKVQVYVSENPAKQVAFWENRRLLYEGEIVSYNYYTQGDEFNQRLQIQISKTEKEFQITQSINRTNSSLAPENSIGKYLPFVFGENIQVVPYSIAPDYQQGNIGFGFLYASCFRSFDSLGRKFLNRGISKYLYVDRESLTGITKTYREVKSAPDFATPVYQQNGDTVIGFNNTAISRKKCYPVNYTPGVTNPYIVTTVNLVISSPSNPGTPSASGLINIRLHGEVDGLQVPKSPDDYLATATIDKAAYAAQYAAGGVFNATACFDVPVGLCSLTKGYYISIDLTNEEDLGSFTNLNLVDYAAGTPVGARSWETNNSDNEDNGGWRPATEGNVSAIFQLLGVEFVDQPEGIGIPSAKGLEVSGVGMKWQDYSGSRKIFGFDQLDIILEMSGIEDTDGAITGVPGQLLTSPVDIAELLLHYYEENRWQPGLFDRTKFAETHKVFNIPTHQYYRKISGRTNGNSTNLEALSEIMRNSYSTLMYDGFGSNPGYGVVGVGYKRAIAGSISDHDGKFERFFFNDINTIVNDMSLSYARRLDKIHYQTAKDQEQFGEYSKTYTINGNDGDLGQTLSAGSLLHYGERSLDNENFDWLKDDISAENVAKLFLSIHEHPFQLTQFEGAYSNLKHYKMYDLLLVSSTELPNAGGTSARAYPNKNECGILGDVANVGLYKAEILAVGFNSEAQSIPSVTFLLRLITNENDPLF